jgi:hypothetical protein
MPDGTPNSDKSPTTAEAAVKTATANTSWRKKMTGAIGDVFKALIPERVAKLGDKHGPGLFAGFLLGLFIGIPGCIATLIKAESLRNILFPAPAAATSRATSTAEEPRDKLSTITFSRVESVPPFLSDYEKLFGEFAESKRPSGTLENPPVGVVNYVCTKAVNPFVFSLQPLFKESEINVRVFREFKISESRTIYEPLVPQNGSSAKGFTFRVNQCNANDRLLMVLLVSPRQQGINSFTDYFKVSLIE